MLKFGANDQSRLFNMFLSSDREGVACDDSRSFSPEQRSAGGLKLPRHAFHLWFATTAPCVAQLLFGFGKLLATLEAG